MDIQFTTSLGILVIICSVWGVHLISSKELVFEHCRWVLQSWALLRYHENFSFKQWLTLLVPFSCRDFQTWRGVKPKRSSLFFPP